MTGSINATGTAASFDNSEGVAVDASGNVYIADTYNSVIREITSGGVVATLAGSVGVTGSTNGTGTAALFDLPTGVAVDSSGNVYVADSGNNQIREIAPGGVVTTWAGTGTAPGYDNAPRQIASFNNPSGIAIDASGTIYIADTGNNEIRKFFTGTQFIGTFAGQVGVPGSANGTGTAASFNAPTGVAVDSSGNVYVADFGNNMIREITFGGVVSTLAGSGSPGNTNATGTAASFNGPWGVAVDASSNVYVADEVNNLIREIGPGGMVSTLAGKGSPGAHNGAAISAMFYSPMGVAVDSSGNIYIGDTLNQLIREITP